MRGGAARCPRQGHPEVTPSTGLLFPDDVARRTALYLATNGQGDRKIGPARDTQA